MSDASQLDSEWIKVATAELADELRGLGFVVHLGGLVDTETAAVVLAKSKRTLEFWRYQGEGPPIAATGARGQVLYRLVELVQYKFLSRPY